MLYGVRGLLTLLDASTYRMDIQRHCTLIGPFLQPARVLLPAHSPYLPTQSPYTIFSPTRKIKGILLTHFFKRNSPFSLNYFWKRIFFSLKKNKKEREPLSYLTSFFTHPRKFTLFTWRKKRILCSSASFYICSFVCAPDMSLSKEYYNVIW